MNAKLQCFEVERAISGDDDFAVDHGARRQLRSKRPQQFGEVPVQRFFITALDKDLVAVAKNQRAKPIPFGLEDPLSSSRKFSDALGKHRQNRRIDGKLHASILYLAGWPGQFALPRTPAGECGTTTLCGFL